MPWSSARTHTPTRPCCRLSPKGASSGPDGTAGFWVIRVADAPKDLWSNADGWTSGPDITVFDGTDSGLHLPIGGEWVRLRIAA